jgi:hypothetical protein
VPPPHFERPVRISRPSNWLGLGIRSHVVCDLHLCIPIPSIKNMKSLIFSSGHLDRQFQITYRSRGIFICKTDTFRQLCVRQDLTQWKDDILHMVKWYKLSVSDNHQVIPSWQLPNLYSRNIKLALHNFINIKCISITGSLRQIWTTQGNFSIGR